jgi:AI-2 transport protein TqsA
MPVTLVALVFWGWVLGPLGAILAIPLTLLVKAVLVDTDPSAAWAIALFGSTREMRHESEAELSEESHSSPSVSERHDDPLADEDVSAVAPAPGTTQTSG